MSEIECSIEVNGKATTLRAHENTPLLYLLRNQLELKGARFGCGTGHCGACTVLIDGHAEQSCTTPLWSLRGRAVTTVEELAVAGDPLFDAIEFEQAAQCGYCLPGIICSVRGYLNAHADATENGLLAYLDERNLCRCGTHVRIKRALRRVLGIEP